MPLRTLRRVLAVLALLVLSGATGATSAGSAATVEPEAGPPYDFTTELVGQFPVVPLKNLAMLYRTDLGYRLEAGQQNSDVVVRLAPGGLRVADTGTASFKQLSPACRQKQVRVGVAAVCRLPGGISTSRPLLVELWPRLGDDLTDASSLPATFAVTMLADAGNDRARFGAGPDFFNGFSGRDRVWGGPGNDWIRSGLDDDTVWGGPGDDRLVAVEGRDTLYGGPGDDRVGGGDGDDHLFAGTGTDFVLCGAGQDTATVDAADRVFHDCEVVDRT